MDSKEEVKELIAHYRNLFNQLWNGLLLLSGGLAGLAFKWDSPVAKGLIIVGGILWVALSFLMVYAHIQAKRLIRRL